MRKRLERARTAEQTLDRVARCIGLGGLHAYALTTFVELIDLAPSERIYEIMKALSPWITQMEARKFEIEAEVIRMNWDCLKRHLLPVRKHQAEKNDLEGNDGNTQTKSEERQSVMAN